MKANRKFKIHWKRNLFNALNYLPKFVRVKVIRSFFTFDYNLPKNLTFSVAESSEEYEQAFHILYSNFKKLNYIDANDAKMAHSKFHALPSTTILIAKLDDTVIATMAIISDSSFGLPMEDQWNLNQLRNFAPRIAEIGSLAIHPDYQGLRGKILLPLCSYMLRCCKDYLGIDLITIATINEVASFYEALFSFNLLDRKAINYKRVKGRKTSAQYLDLRLTETLWKKQYSRMQKNKNLYEFCVTHNFENFILPKRTYYSASFKTMPASTMNNLFNEKLPIFKKMDDIQRAQIRNNYTTQNYSNVIGGKAYHELFPRATDRKDFRFKVKCPIKIIENTENISFMEQKRKSYVLDVSRDGLLISNRNPEKLLKPFTVFVQVSKEIKIKLKVKACWTKNGMIGLKIIAGKNNQWNDFINHLSSSISPFEQSLAA